MKKFDSRIYLYVAAAGILLILGLVVFYILTPVSKSESVEYVYIDEDDSLCHARQDSRDSPL